MNWRKITTYAAALFAAQVLVGFFEGSFAPAGASITLVSCVVSLVVCGSIFTHLAAHQPSKPFAHAWAALVLQIAVAATLSQALVGWLGGTPMALVALEWLVLICALLVGTAVGRSLGRSTGQPADA